VVARFSDLDALGHVNNARYFNYMEEVRYRYAVKLGLWTAAFDVSQLGQIVAEASCSFKRPITLGQTVDVAMRTARLGVKSMDTEYRLTVAGEEVAFGRTVQVTYDYTAGHSVPIPDEWRRRIEAFEAGAG
jgi:acyl-CoA thioester hydrolase